VFANRFWDFTAMWAVERVLERAHKREQPDPIT
jgi:hypothetical protein